MELQSFFRYAVLACSITTLAACSSSGSDAPATTTISGSIFASHVDGATVTVKDTSGNDIAGPVTTGHDGFTVSIPDADLASTLVFESTGGTFDDEATGASTDAGAMSVMVAGGSLSSTSNSVHATPGSKIINELVSVHSATMASAETTFASAFSYTPNHSIAPTDATSPATGADNDQLLAGLRAAAFSQLTSDLGLAADQQFDLFSALALDLSDDKLDGQAASGAVSVGGTTIPEDIQNRFSTALLSFHGGANDKTGLNNAQIGVVPFAKVILTDSYRVEYMAGMMDPMEGKSTFTISVTDLSGTPVNSLSPGLMPMMYMADRQHSTPYVDFTNNSDGTYTATVYYLMPSVMMTGDTMGYWDLGIMLNMSETVHFYPTVMMSMGDTARVTLKGEIGVDEIPDMTGGTMSRNYHVFKDSLKETVGNQHTFTVFLAAMETMMSMPAVDTGVVLNQGTAYELTVTSVVVEMSSDDGASWVTANNDGSGYFSGDLHGLTTGTAAPIRVRVQVNSTYKTTDGAARVPDTNDYQTLSVTPTI